MQTTNDIRVTTVSRPAIPVPRYNGTLGDTMIPAGFPSPAENTHETFDIVDHIVRHPEATFFMRVAGDSMIGAGIFDGDLLVVDRSIEAASGDIVVAVVPRRFQHLRQGRVKKPGRKEQWRQRCMSTSIRVITRRTVLMFRKERCL